MINFECIEAELRFLEALGYLIRSSDGGLHFSKAVTVRPPVVYSETETRGTP